jgi:lipopolysaccharide export system permease protein
MLKVIDRYIIKQFFGGFIFALILIVSVAMTIDLGEHMNKFVQHNLTIRQVFFGFYLYFIPYLIGLLGPYFVLITVIYFTSRLSSKSEIIAMFNSGMSFTRLLRPYLITSIILAIFFWVAVNYFIPYSDVKRLAFENKYIAYQSQSSDAHIHKRLDDSTYFYLRVYDNMAKTAYNVTLEKIVNSQLKEKVMADQAIFDTLTKTWTFNKLFIRTFSDGKEKIEVLETKKYAINLDPSLLIKRWTHIQELNRTELKELIDQLKAQGSDSKLYEIEYHKRTSKCFGIILLTIVGVVLASKKVRGGIGMHLMLGLALGSVYEVIVKFSDSFAIKASLDALTAAWLPNILYTLVAILLWKKIQE